MIALTARTYLKQRENAQKERARKERSLSRFLQVEATAPMPPATAATSAPPRASPPPATPRPAPRDQEQAGLFSRIFKQESTGIEVPHSQSERAVYVNRFGCWVEPLSPEFRRFFHRWFVLGGKTNLAPIHKVQKRYKVVK
jgi:hypothetical protein